MPDRIDLIEPLIPALRRYAWALCRDQHAADDLVQDCLERALSSWLLRRPGGDLRSWLFAILHNGFVSGRRQAARRGAHTGLDERASELGQPAAQESTVAMGDLLAALDTLPDEQRTVLLLVSERGTLGEFNVGQAAVWRTMRPVLEALGMEHHVVTRLDECGFICDRTIKQAVMTQQPAALILSPLLTGGKAVAPRAEG